MSKLPIISGEKTVKCFEKLGYVAVRQKGSHIRMWHIDKGLLRKLLRDAEISIVEFCNLL